MTVLLRRYEASAAAPDTISMVIPPEGFRTTPKIMTFTEREATELFAKLGDLFGMSIDIQHHDDLDEEE